MQITNHSSPAFDLKADVVILAIGRSIASSNPFTRSRDETTGDRESAINRTTNPKKAELKGAECH